MSRLYPLYPMIKQQAGEPIPASGEYLMPNICPRCYSSAVTRVQQRSTPSISSQLGMAALGSQIARHLPVPSPLGHLAGGLIGSILGHAFEPQSRPAPVSFQCNDCQHVFG